MKRLITLFLTAAFIFGGAGISRAIEFNAKGTWDMYFNFGESSFYKKPHDGRNTGVVNDAFEAAQQLHLQLDAQASENLSGTVMFEIGVTPWGYDDGRAGRGVGGQLGADGVSVEVKHAYLNWMMPNTDLRLRMGLQPIVLPNAGGGSAVFDNDAAAVTANYKINDTVGITAMWARPYNDNYVRDDYVGGKGVNNFLDNMDLAVLSIPLTFDGVSLTPWGMFGFAGLNMVRPDHTDGAFSQFGEPSGIYVMRGILPVDMAQGHAGDNPNFNSRGYANMFWAGLPVQISAFDPFNFEIDLNYGWSSGWGRYDSEDGDGIVRRGDTKREGFVVKALAEYKTESWGAPGVFGWYGSGDNGDIRDGSGRMPSIVGFGTFTSFGMGGYYGDFYNVGIGEMVDTSYAGTWGIGAQLADFSFLQDLSHTLRVAYWRGTNDPGMTKFLTNTGTGWNQTDKGPYGLYLTTNDYLVEFNLDSKYKIYENLEAAMELGYIINGVDKDTWKWGDNQKTDAWKCAVTFRYDF